MFPYEDSKTLSVCPYPEKRYGFVNISPTLVIDTGAGGHILWLGEVWRPPPPSLLTSACAFVGLVLVPQMCFCFVGLPFFPSASWPLSFLSSLFRLLPTLLDSCANAWEGKGFWPFVHGHTFLHSWSGLMTVVVGLLHGATFLSNLSLVLFVSFIRP